MGFLCARPCSMCSSARMCTCFFQAEAGIRDLTVTGVQTCALPICRRPRAFALVAIGLTLLVVAGLLGPRLVRTVRTGGSQTSPAAAGAPSPTPVPTPAPVSACRLPVIVTDSHATINPPADAQTDDLDVETAGFVEMATGRFQPDPAAVQDGMPFSRSYLKDVWRPQTDDPVLRRWLPVQPSQVAPDHGSYL